jgi:dihydrofolate reductase
MEKYVMMTTSDGYMIYDNDNDDYINDDLGDNLWDTIDEVNNILNKLKMEKEKQLFIIDGYKIWAYTIEEAQQHYQMIKNF